MSGGTTYLFGQYQLRNGWNESCQSCQHDCEAVFDAVTVSFSPSWNEYMLRLPCCKETGACTGQLNTTKCKFNPTA